MAAPTIPTLKRTFLAAQVRLLSAPLAPAPDWRADAPPPEADDDATHTDLPDSAVDTAIDKGTPSRTVVRLFPRRLPAS